VLADARSFRSKRIRETKASSDVERARTRSRLLSTVPGPTQCRIPRCAPHSRSQSSPSQGARVVIAHQRQLSSSSDKSLRIKPRERAELTQIKVVPLAAESLGVRSLCTYVETPSLRIVLDAGVSLCPTRFRLPPHPREFHAIIDARQRIAEHAERADVITISHYHFDHHTPSFADWLCHWTDVDTAAQLYAGKHVLAKDSLQHVNASQRRRGWVFRKTGGRHARKVEAADGRELYFGETRIQFSPPVAHGEPHTPLGWLLMTTIEHGGERMLFASDVQGPLDPSTLQLILNAQPSLAVVGGPPLYLRDTRVDAQQLERGLRSLEALAQHIPVTIVDHHLLRAAEWRAWAQPALEAARSCGHRMVTAAEFLGRDNQLWEAQRNLLFEREPPGAEFARWAKLPEAQQRVTKPPL
jgi:predicted metallo-beta-lactamase superfamily hydrolase